MTGQDAGQVGDRVQEFVEKWTDDPERLIGPITSIGLNIAGILGALVLILITAYYMAIRPEPLVDGLVRLFPPPRREPRALRARPDAPLLDRLDGGRGDRHARHLRPARASG